MLASHVSPRLSQAVAVASSQDAFPFATIGEYLAEDRDVAVGVIENSTGFDKQTARELEALVSKLLRIVERFEAEIYERFIDVLPLSPIGELFADEFLPARVSRALELSGLGSLSFRDYIQRRADVERSMKRLGNCGDRTLMAMRAFASRLADRQLAAAGFELSERRATLKRMFGNVPIFQFEVTPEEGWPAADLAEFLERLLHVLPTRTANILKRRFGIGGTGSETLADIGNDLRLTRERVRQVEAKGIRLLQSIARRHPIEPFLQLAREEGWTALSAGRQHLTEVEAQASLRRQDGNLLLALEVAGISDSDWLSRIGIRIGSGWIGPHRYTSSVCAAGQAIERQVRPGALPRSLAGLASEAARDDLEAAATLLLGMHVQDGYLFSKRPTLRLRRAVWLHSLLVNRRRPTDLIDLYHEYRAAVPEDACSYRDALIVMEAARHLFVEISDGVWVGIGLAGSVSSDSIGEADVAPPISDDPTILGALERELARSGPTRLGLLLERSADVLPAGRSVNSIGPTLLMNRDRFVRPLPGVYALPSHVPNLNETLFTDRIDYLLDPNQARLYSLGRRSGEHWGVFPLWTSAAEYRLCRWARGNARPELFRTLLSVASPDEWPVAEEEKSAWCELAALHGRFELSFASKQVDPFTGGLDRILAACVHVTHIGHIGWLACNRILGLRIDSQTANALLDVLVTVRIVDKPPGDDAWQMPHPAGPALREWTDRLLQELGESGELSWNGPAGCALAIQLGRPHQEPSMLPPIGELDEFELLLIEHRRLVRSKRQLEALEWLGVE